MRFMLFVIDEATPTATSDELREIGTFNDGLRAGNHWVTAAGLAAPSEATVIESRGGSVEVTPGSLFTSARFYSGFWIIEAADRDEALILAGAAAKACNRALELRPLL